MMLPPRAAGGANNLNNKGYIIGNQKNVGKNTMNLSNSQLLSNELSQTQ